MRLFVYLACIAIQYFETFKMHFCFFIVHEAAIHGLRKVIFKDIPMCNWDILCVSCSGTVCYLWNHTLSFPVSAGVKDSYSTLYHNLRGYVIPYGWKICIYLRDNGKIKVLIFFSNLLQSQVLRFFVASSLHCFKISYINLLPLQGHLWNLSC